MQVSDSAKDLVTTFCVSGHIFFVFMGTFLFKVVDLLRRFKKNCSDALDNQYGSDLIFTKTSGLFKSHIRSLGYYHSFKSKKYDISDSSIL